MRKRILIVPLLIAGFVASSQQRPHYTQYILNNYILNPALSGIENYADVKFSMRDQWVGLNGAPKTSYFSIQGPIGKNDYRTTSTSFEVPGQNPRGKYYWENYTAAEPHHGIGMTLINDKTGSFNRFSANLTYAYHLGLSPTTNLSAGFSAGITRVGIDRSKQDFSGTGDPSDPATGSAISGEINKIRPDLGVGLWLYSRNYFVGLAAQQVIPQKLQFVDDAAIVTKGRLVPHIFLTAGYRFLIGEDVNAIPSVMVKYISNSAKAVVQPEVNLKLQYRDLAWIGGSYRHENGYAAMAGFHVSNTVNVGYAYDFTTTALNTVSQGTHEFMIGLIFGNKYSEKCPRCW
ncbi:MAG TPA: type IX secretion system membrane protein PorP/SprF [Chitinophagaceae bacterium]|nr:type IX secretion system membrane protein PorP/SprF [Chitinophagaceae bacterium]HPG12037.1 type IX secretion system membrane protein PorP/SprF [Chitinophagaceae bacterium]HRX94382.1 type IX secretion system membrane protein PorP/SprF [Chitinophagaceae bacterium]